MKHHRCRGDSTGHLDAVDAFARIDHDPVAIGEDQAVVACARIDRAVGGQIAQIDPVLAFVGQAVANDPANLRD